MTDIERYQERDAWIPVRQDIETLAKLLASTPFVGAFRGKPGDVFGAIMYGHELHLAPLQALQALDSIDGKPTLKAEALRALFFREGHRLEVVAWDDKRCTVRAERRDGLSSVEVTYSMRDAEIAGLAGKKNWRTSPKSMLYARASAMAIKAVAPDIALGIDTSDSEPVTGEEPVRTTVVQVMPAITPGNETRPADQAPTTVGSGDTQPAGRETSTPIMQPAETIPPDLITPAQMRMIGALIGKWETRAQQRLDPDQRRALIAQMAGLGELDSAKNLTRAQASTAIDQFTNDLGKEGSDET